MARVLPILFNTDMVRAILDGRKTVTRRLIKFPVNKFTDEVTKAANVSLAELKEEKAIFHEEPFYSFYVKPPYQPGDYIYVRETFSEIKNADGSHKKYVYRATDTFPFGEKGYIMKFKWHPSIHMPKEAARIWLKVLSVRVERLQECGKDWCLEIEKEGVVSPQDPILYINDDKFHDALREEFKNLWNSTIKKSDLVRYGWDANPWVWVVEFERCEKPIEEL